MGMFDDLQNKSQNAMNNSETWNKIQQLARDKGISMESAKKHFMKHGEQSK